MVGQTTILLPVSKVDKLSPGTRVSKPMILKVTSPTTQENRIDATGVVSKDTGLINATKFNKRAKYLLLY